MLIDTHCHLNMLVKPDFDRIINQQELQDAAVYIQEARTAAVNVIINVGTSMIENNNTIQIAQHYQHVYAALGIHPNDVTEMWKHELEELEQLVLLYRSKVVAIGEVGLDYHYPEFNKQRQTDAFKAQIELALKHDLALVVHSRDAIDDTLHVLEEYHKELKRCVIHCFSEGIDIARQIVSWNYYLGIGGTITYPKNNFLRQVVLEVPMSSIVLETDAPFLPPQAIRGKKNTPAQIHTIAQYIADLKNVTLADIAQVTTANATALFGLTYLDFSKES